MTILIPAYEPSNRLIKLVYELKSKYENEIVIVDDGSGDAFRDIFKLASKIGCTVLTHNVNKGKGEALKTGFNYIKESNSENGVVCADCDGQHLPEDIIKIAESVKSHSNCILLGTRKFTGKVPLRSRFGNSVTRNVFAFASGLKIYDTQTGLRGYSPEMLEWLCEVPGERFEYEMNILLEAAPSGYDLYEIDIDTVYLEQNKSSHFRAFRDSARIYMPIIKFSLSSILSAILDFLLLILLQIITSNLFIAVAGARFCSAIFNYITNRFYVFTPSKKATNNYSMPKYFLLATFIMLVNYSLIHFLNEILSIPLFFSKIFTEITIFFFSFWSQRKFVFNSNTKNMRAK